MSPFIIITLIAFSGAVYGHGWGGHGNYCYIVASTTTSCPTTGPACSSQTDLGAALAVGPSVKVCRKGLTVPETRRILVNMQTGINCPNYSGFTGLCFIPDKTDTTTCPTLAANAVYIRKACDDATQQATLGSQTTARICKLNPNGFMWVDATVPVSLYLEGLQNING